METIRSLSEEQSEFLLEDEMSKWSEHMDMKAQTTRQQPKQLNMLFRKTQRECEQGM